MAAQAASTNDRRVTRLSSSATATTLTPITKAYAARPSHTMHSSSLSSSTAVSPTLADAFAFLAVDKSYPQPQELNLRSAKFPSQNVSQLAESLSVIDTRSAELRSPTVARLAEPRPQASARSTRTNNRDDKNQRSALKSGTRVHSDPMDRLVKGIGAVQIHQPRASTHSQAPSPPVPATPAIQKRGRSDYEEESPIDECLAKLYLDHPPLPATSTSTSASTLTPTVTPLLATTKTISTSISHSCSAKTSSKDVMSSADKPVNVEADGELDQEIPLPLHIEHRILRHVSQRKPYPTNDNLVDLKALQQFNAEWDELSDLHTMALVCWMAKNPESILPFGVYFSCVLQRKGTQRSKSQLEADEVRFNMALHSLRATRQYYKVVAAARTFESQQRHAAYKQYLCAQPRESASIELQRKYEKAPEQRKKSIQDAWNKARQQHRELSQSYHQTPSQYKQGLEELAEMTSHPWVLRDLCPVQSSSLDSVSSSSRQDKNKTSKDHERRKRAKHDDIKQEPVDEKMTDTSTACTSSSTSNSATSTTSTFSTSPSHTIADVTLDMQHKLSFNPTTATSQ